MKYIILCFCFVILFYNISFCDTTEVLIDTSGNIIVAKNIDQIKCTWLEMLIRGTYHDSIGFDSTLYNAYYQRKIKTNKGIYSIQASNNFRDNVQDSVLKAWDVPKIQIKYSNADSILEDSKIQTILTNLGYSDEDDDIPLYEKWNWGNMELLRFAPIYFDDIETELSDSLTKKPQNHKIEKEYIKDSTGYVIITIKNIKDDNKYKDKFKNYLIKIDNENDDIDENTTLWELFKNKKVKKKFIRNPKISKKVKPRWIEKK